MDPVQAVASLTALVDAIKKARDVAKRLKDNEVLELLLDAQEGALALREEMASLREENLSLKQQLAESLSMAFEGGAYWRDTEQGRDGPFCSRCFDVDRKAVRMRPTQGHYHACPNCDQRFEVTSAPSRPSPAPIRRNLPRV